MCSQRLGRPHPASRVRLAKRPDRNVGGAGIEQVCAASGRRGAAGERAVVAPSAVLAVVRPRLTSSGILLIDGRSGSGKSTLAGWLAERLEAQVLQMEDLYPGWGGLHAAAELLSTRILPALVAGRPASWRTWDWTSDRHGAVRWVRPGGRWIVEGCGALTSASRPLADFAVVLDVDERERRRRILDRDPPETLPGHGLWAVEERRLLARAPWPALADLVVRGGVRDPGHRSGDARRGPR